jgi:hypothetical protein
VVRQVFAISPAKGSETIIYLAPRGNCNIERKCRPGKSRSRRRPLRRGETMKWPMPAMPICLASRCTTRPDTWIILQPKASDTNDQQALAGQLK